MLRRALPVAAAVLLMTACGGSSPPSPAPPAGAVETITGRERIGWDQAAGSAADLTGLRYAIYVDNVRSEVADVTCATPAGPSGFACTGRFPQMSNGSHVLEMATFMEAGGIVESPKSAPFRVTVAGVAAGAVGPLAGGEVVTTNDGVQLVTDVLISALREPGALAITPDGRAFVGTADGLLIVEDGRVAGPPQLTDGRTLAIAVSPQFEKDGYVFVTQAVPGASGRTVFRTSRLRDMGGWLADRMVLLEHGPAAAAPSAGLRFAADGKLHLTFDDGGSAEAAERMSEWRGKLLRMEPDGRTPADQPAASPVLWRGLTSPRGFDWAADGTTLWLADASRDGFERLRVIALPATQPRRASLNASYLLPKGLGASGVAFGPAAGVPEFAGNLFVAGRDGGYVLRLRFDDQGKPISAEKLLAGQPIGAVSFGIDGAMYILAGDALVRLAPR